MYIEIKGQLFKREIFFFFKMGTILFIYLLNEDSWDMV